MTLNYPYDPELHHRRSIRLPGYDYAEDGGYFVTVVTREREMLFGDVVDGEMRLNATGQLVLDSWKWLTVRYPYVELDTHVVMPNHLHGIIVITGRHPMGDEAGDPGIAPAPRKSLGRLVGAFKTVTTKQVNLARGTPGRPLWQRNYYERVVRGERELALIREYIVNNPMQWGLDAENPAAGAWGGSRTAPTWTASFTNPLARTANPLPRRLACGAPDALRRERDVHHRRAYLAQRVVDRVRERDRAGARRHLADTANA